MSESNTNHPETEKKSITWSESTSSSKVASTKAESKDIPKEKNAIKSPTKISSSSVTSATASTSTAPDDSISDVLEERLIDAEYKIWKKNTPYLYDVVMTHSLEWPSLTCQWLPYFRQPDGQATEEHNLLIGTHTTGEQNYLMVASAILPKSENSVVVGDDAKTSSEEKKDGKASETVVAASPIPHYDEERNEVGGFGFTGNPAGSSGNSGNNNTTTLTTTVSTPGKIEIRMKVKHLGEVNRARYMPQNHFIVATRGPDPELYVFDLSKHSSFPEDDSECAPQCVCVGHEKEGYGLAWSPHQEGLLASSSEDNTVNIWDVSPILNASATSSNQVKPKSTFVGHTDVVEDVAWHNHDANLIGSVGDDKCVMLWDIRQPKPQHLLKDAHEGDINCIAFNPVNEFLFATGSADKTVALWDLRNLKA